MFALGQGQVDASIAQQRKALRLRRRNLGPHDPAVAESLANLAIAYRAAGRRRRASRLLRRAMRILERDGVRGERYRHALTRRDYGWIRYERGCRDAEAEVRGALDELISIAGPRHPEVAETQTDLARIVAAQGGLKEAFELLLSAADGQIRGIGPVFASSPEHLRLRYVTKLHEVRDLILSLLTDYLGTEPGPVADGLKVVIQRTGLTLDAVIRQRQALLHGRYPDLADDLKRLAEVEKQLAETMLGLGDMPSARKTRDLESERDRLQVRLAGEVVEIKIDRDLVHLSVPQIAARLPQGAAFVQYVHFAYRPPGPSARARDHYAAFCLSPPDYVVRFVHLGPAAEIDQLIRDFSAALMPTAARGVRVFAGHAMIDWRTPAASLYTAVLAPLKLGSRRLIVVPDGRLHRVPLSALITPDGQPVIAETVVHHLVTARDLLTSILGRRA